MARTTTPENASRRLNGYAASLQNVQRQAVEAAALSSTTIIRNEIRKAVGADMKMSGVGKRGAKVGAGYTVRGYKNPSAVVAARGLHLVERRTKPHRIPKQRGRRARRRVVKIGDNVRMYANHPGTPGKRPFERGTAQAQRVAPRVFEKVIFDSFRQRFG